MAELLIKAEDNRHEDPVKDRRGAYKRGDVVVVREDRHEWGSAECLPIFWRVRVPDVQAAAFSKYTNHEHDPFVPSILMTRRRWHFNVHALSGDDRATLETTGVIDLTWEAVVQALVDKPSGKSDHGRARE